MNEWLIDLSQYDDFNSQHNLASQGGAFSEVKQHERVQVPTKCFEWLDIRPPINWIWIQISIHLGLGFRVSL
jgi:hypothetical protein